MPLYEFACLDCDRTFELLVASPRWKGSRCPHCGSTKLTKSFSTFTSKVAAGKTAAAPPPMACPRGGTCACACAHGH